MSLVREIKLDLVPVAIALVFVAIVVATLNSVGLQTFKYKSVWLSIFIFSVLILHWTFARILIIYIREKPESPIKRTKEYFVEALSIHSLSRTVPIILCLLLFMPAFSSMKASISIFSDYRWDDTFIYADRIIHGNDAWRVIHPIFGYPIVTSIINVLYHIWLALIYIITFYFAINYDLNKIRFQYITSFFLCWSIIGTVFAIIFASVGPCFLLPIQGDGTFVPLMDYLRSADNTYSVPALKVQDILLAQLRNGDSNLGAGITAMPSMHVSIATLFYLAARRLSSYLGYVFLAYLIAILIGSVHLGYHYAVDGYFAIACTVIIWKLTGWLADYIQQADEVRPTQKLGIAT